MTRKRAAPRPSYAALRAFARGYLHEDFVQEHGDALGAARAFAADATSAERRQLSSELRHLAELASRWSGAQLVELLNDTLGARWATPTLEALRQMAEELDD